MKKRIEFRKNILIIAAAMLFVIIQLSVNAQKGQKWAVDGNELSNGDFIGSTNNEPFIIKTNNNERLRVKINGNVGIGTSTPASLFSVGEGSPFQVNSTGDIKTNNIIANGSLTVSSLTGILSSNGSGPVYAYVGVENYIPKWSGGSLKY